MGKWWDLPEAEKKKIEDSRERLLIEMRGYKREPTIEEVIEGYKKLIQTLGGKFIEFTELYNQALQIAKKYGFIESTLTARIKDFSSSNSNTDNKELDDMFGMEIATPTELEKEELILFNELIFKNMKSKIWNKTEEEGGYSAYHSTGIVQINYNEDLEKQIVDIIKNTTTEEWTSSKDKNLSPDERIKKSPFKNLQHYIENPIKLALLVSIMERMIYTIVKGNVKFDEVPIIEFHFLTLEKQREAIIGNAAHSKYKNGLKEQKIKELYDDEKLFRGINAPWKWEGDEEGLKLQEFYVTLAQNWPFLTDSIQTTLATGDGQNAIRINNEFDEQLASIFPFLSKYVDGEICDDPYKQAELWGKFKTLIMHYRLDFSGNKQMLAREALNYLPENQGEKEGEQK